MSCTRPLLHPSSPAYDYQLDGPHVHSCDRPTKFSFGADCSIRLWLWSRSKGEAPTTGYMDSMHTCSGCCAERGCELARKSTLQLQAGGVRADDHLMRNSSSDEEFVSGLRGLGCTKWLSWPITCSVMAVTLFSTAKKVPQSRLH